MRLTARNLWFGYDSRTILAGVNLEVATGEAVAILGPSGVGKTTLLAMLGGMLRPRSGRVAVDDRLAPRDWVGWVLQTVNVLPHRTALDNAALGAAADGVGFRAARRFAAELLGQVGLASVASVPARQLSGGELQRVVIARGLASDRPFLLADEPTGQLDRATTELVTDTLVAARDRRGVVVATHDAAVAARCNRVYCLVDGRLADAGPS
jgi:putative ABC transport system ATP-binding protein/lipoprotein-releasing system ATP-binding protein